MIIKTTKTINGIEYAYTYSDAGMKIMRDGVMYDESVDPINSNRVYTETDEPISSEVEEATEADYQDSLREMGVKL